MTVTPPFETEESTAPPKKREIILMVENNTSRLDDIMLHLPTDLEVINFSRCMEYVMYADRLYAAGVKYVSVLASDLLQGTSYYSPDPSKKVTLSDGTVYERKQSMCDSEGISVVDAVDLLTSKMPIYFVSINAAVLQDTTVESLCKKRGIVAEVGTSVLGGAPSFFSKMRRLLEVARATEVV